MGRTELLRTDIPEFEEEQNGKTGHVTTIGYHQVTDIEGNRVSLSGGRDNADSLPIIRFKATFSQFHFNTFPELNSGGS